MFADTWDRISTILSSGSSTVNMIASTFSTGAIKFISAMLRRTKSVSSATGS